jgi:DNA-directed RNA polymerase subunit RPC12/RpoP
MTDRYITWDIKCETCGFEFSVGFNENETEENKKELRSCPCGGKTKIVKERVYGNDR